MKTMLDCFYVAWRYICFHKFKTIILVASITLIVFLPAGVDALVKESAEQLRLRAQETPLIVGMKGSETDLVLNSLYFESVPPAPCRMAEVGRIRQSGLAQAIPLNIQYNAAGSPIVGTTLDYFAFRKLQIGQGRQFAMLGECVLGHGAAQKLGLKPGGSVLSSPENVFDLAGVYPLKMRVAGILKPTGTPDDSAVFVDVKTTWIIAGLGHGHQDLSQSDAKGALLKKDGNRLIANASVRTYTEITPENVGSFHFHGDLQTFPITSVLAVPHDQKSKALLMGRYQSSDERGQIVEPPVVMDDLLATILRVRAFILAGSLLLGIATTMAVALVFTLSIRLRRQELITMMKIGGSRLRIVSIVALEIVFVIGLSGGIAACLTLATRQFGEHLIRWFLL